MAEYCEDCIKKGGEQFDFVNFDLKKNIEVWGFDDSKGLCICEGCGGRFYQGKMIYDINGKMVNCPEDPELLKGQPIGMYHCPFCGHMIMAGVPHPLLKELDKEFGVDRK